MKLYFLREQFDQASVAWERSQSPLWRSVNFAIMRLIGKGIRKRWSRKFLAKRLLRYVGTKKNTRIPDEPSSFQNYRTAAYAIEHGIELTLL